MLEFQVALEVISDEALNINSYECTLVSMFNIPLKFLLVKQQQMKINMISQFNRNMVT